MIGSLIKKIIGSKNERELKRIQPIVRRINQIEPQILPLNDEQLRAKAPEFKERIDRGSRWSRSFQRLLLLSGRQRKGPLESATSMSN